MPQCVATVLLFSGRPDPTWAVDDEYAAQLRSLWKDLPSATAPEPKRQQLGYRGVLLICGSDAELLAFGGLIRSRSKGKTEWRSDPDRAFERLLVSTAPAGMLPPRVLEF